MGNCLKTQLKEVVNNPNLEPLGYLTVLQDLTKHANIIKSTEDYAEVKFINCTYLGERTLLLGKDIYYTFDTNNFILDAGETIAKYQIPYYVTNYLMLYTNQGNFDISKTSFSEDGNWGFLGGCIITGNVETIYSTNNRYSFVGVTEGKIIDVTQFGLTDKPHCYEFSSSTQFTGSLDNTGYRIAMFIGFPLNFPRTKNVSITIENFVKNCITVETTGSCTLKDSKYCTVYFKGSELASITNESLSWEPYGTNQTKITFNGDEEIINNE